MVELMDKSMAQDKTNRCAARC